MTYENTTLIIHGAHHEDSEQFRDWVAANYPEITIDYREDSGIDSGHFINNWDNLDDDQQDALKAQYGHELFGAGELDSRLWEAFCNSQ